ncbi:MAG TPA: hypothetical protein VNR36_13245 [Pseudolysinimonas sp.]|nr:hypothetical protein [Pseudolysinimonas sp.]
MTSFLRLARALRSDERGIALPVVFGVGLVMLMLVAGSMTVTMSNVRKTNTDEDWNGALAAAYAGVEEYQSRLANDSTYQKYGNPSAPFSTGTGSTLTLPTGANTNNAFGIGTAGTWATIPGSDGTASYRYEVDNGDYQDKGVLHLRSTGRVGNVTRSVVVDLKQDGFIDYLWFTNYEVSDPSYTGATSVDSDGKYLCERYAWASPARDTSNSTPCGNIQFGASDVFSGPVRSNDRLLICETTFKKAVLTSSTTSPIFKTASGCGAPDFRVGTATYAPPIDMPPTNTEMKKETRSDLPSDVPRPGCLYTGPTVINFETVSGVPKMRVYSPWTVKTNVTGSNSGSTPSACGTPGTGTNGLGSTTGAVINVLERNLVYIQAVPASCSGSGCDPNAPTSSSYLPNGFTCTSASGSGNSKIPAGWQFRNTSTSAVIQKFPAVISGNNEVTPSGGGSGGLTHYGCKAGDLFVKGALGGQITLAAENYIYVTGDLTYLDAASDMLGLVGQNAVFVWNPVRYSSSAFRAMLSEDREIHAAILSVGHTFQVQNYERAGARGTLTIVGAIAQKFRGAVGQGTNGYVKDYQYDERFKFTAPPKFLTPVSTTYGVTQFASVPAGFKPSGATGP